MNPRVIYVEQGLGFGGAVSILANSIPYLQRLGCEVQVIMSRDDTRSIQALTGQCDRLHILPYERRAPATSKTLETLGARRSLLKWPYLGWVTAKEAIEEANWARRLLRVFKVERPNIVHGNNGPGFNRTALLLARAMRIRSMVSVRGGGPNRTWLGRLAERSCDWEVFMSEYMRCTCSGRNAGTSVLYDGLDMQQWPTPEVRMDSSCKVRFGHVGMLTQWKGQAVFLRAATQVGQRCPNAEFYVFGDVPSRAQAPYALELKKIAEGSSCAERIHFMGFCRDVPKALRSIDVLVHSSIDPEPFGMVILEGMASGLAVIASDAGGPREIISHGEDGLLVAPGKPELLADAMTELAGDVRRVELLGRAARKKVEEMFSAERAARELVNVYRRILKP